MSQEPVSRFITNWREKHEAKEHDLSKPLEQEEFLAAANSLLRHLAHTTHKATIYTVLDKDAVSTVFVRITQ